MGLLILQVISNQVEAAFNTALPRPNPGGSGSGVVKQDSHSRHKMVGPRGDACLLLGNGSFERKGETMAALMHLGGQDCNGGDIEVRGACGPCNLESVALEPSWALI